MTELKCNDIGLAHIIHSQFIQDCDHTLLSMPLLYCIYIYVIIAIIFFEVSLFLIIMIFFPVVN